MEKRQNLLTSPQMTAPLLFMLTMLMLELGKHVLLSGDYNDNLYFTASVMQIAAYLFPCALYYLLKRRKLSSPMLIEPVGVGGMLLVLPVFLLLISGTILIKYFAYVGYGGTVSMSGYYSELLSMSDNSIGVIVAVILLPAICEEILFRGVLMSEYRSLGSVNAIIMTALLFAMMHLSFGDFVLNFCAAILLGLVASATGSVVSSIAVHAAANAFALFGVDAYIRNTVLKCGAFFVGFVMICIFAISLILTLVRLEHIYYRRAEKPRTDVLPPRSIENASKVFFSPTFMLSIAAFILLTIYLR